jgi:predicted enzyme related to lactoylglutathione lyase/ADP-ribosylglycohydrolase
MWIKGTPPWAVNESKAVQRYFDAGGNGVTMRVLPHSIFYACEEDPTALMRDVVTDGVATHGHPRALVGATAYAFAAWWLLRSEHTVGFGELVQVLLEKSAIWGALPASRSARNGWLNAANRSTPHGYDAAWSSVVKEMRNLLHRVEQGLNAGAVADDDEILRDLGCFGKAKGAGTVSTAAAVYLCARYAAQPVQAVLKAAFAHRADTDTIAAMSGSLVGCLSGRDWLPREWTAVQDYEYLCQMANELAQGPSAIRNRPAALRTISQKDLDALRAALVDGHKGKLDLDGIRQAEIKDFLYPKPLSKTTVAQVWRLQASDGQTLYVTKLGRKSSSDSRTESSRNTSNEPSMLRTNERASFSATAVGVKLTVTDLKAMAAFYENVLGLSSGKRSHRFVSYGALSLIDAKAATNLSGGAVVPTADARRHRIQVHVSDIDAAYRRVQEAGIEVLQPITAMQWGDRVFHCTDPENNLVEVAQPR